ncbi:MAG: GxxExxY protein [Caldilineaceae bacterium]
MDEKLLYSRESYRLRGMMYSVRNQLKLGWSEEVYHQAMVHLAEQNRVPILSKPKTILTHRGVQVHAFEPDIIAWDKIILELKALPYTQDFLYEHYAQLIHYLKFFQKRLGFLVNFATPELQIKRVIWAEPPLEISQDFSILHPQHFVQLRA